MKSFNLQKLLLSVSLSALFAVGGSYLFAQTGGSPQADSSQQADDSQKAQELEKTEEVLDERIAQFNAMFSEFADLKAGDVNHSPSQTRFRRGSDYIELEKYDFIKESFASNKVVGRRTKYLRLYFNGETLNRVESEMVEVNFKTGKRHISRVVDGSPASAETSDIEVFTQNNQEPPNETTLGEMENTISNPNRIKFKREFYLEHLKVFERYFRYTKKYRELYGSNTDYNSIETMKKSLDYWYWIIEKKEGPGKSGPYDLWAKARLK